MQTYRDVIETLRQHHFIDPDGSNLADFETLLSTALRVAHAHQGSGPVYGSAPLTPLPVEGRPSLSLPMQASGDLRGDMQALPRHLNGSVKSNHPRLVKNVLPTPSQTYLSSYVAASVYMGNGVTAEDAGNAGLAELQMARFYADLAGYDIRQAGGLFTFGGTGVTLYAFRMGIEVADPGYAYNGPGHDLVIVGSKPAHFCQPTAVSWLGLGRKAYVAARALEDQSTDLVDMEAVCRAQIEAGKRIACIAGVGGTTSCMAIDDFKAMSEMIDRLVADYNLDYRPWLHSDSVIGWAYLYFNLYDFAANPLGFTPRVLDKLLQIHARIETLKYADSFGLDFHKTGYTAYNSSMIICRDRAPLLALGKHHGVATYLFHDETAYRPGTFTLETSRSSANMVATLLTVSSLGAEGFQSLLGHAQEMALTMKDHVAGIGGEFLVVNPDTLGSDVYVRAYPPGLNGAETYAQEAADTALRTQIDRYNDALFDFLITQYAFGPNAVGVGKCSVVFTAKEGHPVVGLRFYILNPYMSAGAACELIDLVVLAKDAFDGRNTAPADRAMQASA